MNALGGAREIAVLGQFGIGNFGNEGSLEAMLRFLRRAAPGANITCVCSEPERVAAAHGVAVAPLRAPPAGPLTRTADAILFGLPSRFLNIAHTLGQCARFEVVIVPGTGVLDDYAAKPSGFPYELWRWCSAARLLGKRVAMVSVGAGPIRTRLSRFFLVNAARSANYRTYRDEGSRAFMTRCRVGQGKDRVFPDLVFGLPVSASPPAANDEPVVAVGVMNHFGWSGEDRALREGYVSSVAAYVRWLIETGRRVILVVGGDRDSEPAEQVLKALGDAARDGRVEFTMAANMAEVMAQVARADIAVVTRFHNLVAALMTGRPAISLGYADKNRELLRSFGLEAYSQHVESIDLDMLKQHTEAMLADATALSEGIRRKLMQVRASLAEQEADLFRWLLGEAPGREEGRVRTGLAG